MQKRFGEQENRLQLHTFITGAAGAFGGGPADVIEWAFALAGFAVDAVRWICGPDLVMDSLIDTCRTKGDAGAIEFWSAFLGAGIGVDNCQVAELFLAMGSCSQCGECSFVISLFGL